MSKYEVRLIIETNEGNPRKWLWNDLIGDEVLEVEANLIEEVANV